MVDNWKLALDARKVAVAVFLDLKKAFDSVDHSLLLTKLRLYGFSEFAIAVIEDYLRDRYFMITLGDQRSDKMGINLGVPQGSILEPFLFLLYINDLCFLKVSSKPS